MVPAHPHGGVAGDGSHVHRQALHRRGRSHEAVLDPPLDGGPDGVVSPDTASSGTYKVRGRFAGVPWRGEFAYVLNDAGFHSRNAGIPAEEATIEGGFVVTPLAGGCTVIHYEQYLLARWLVPLKQLVRLYLRWSMSRELRDLERLIAEAYDGRHAEAA